MAPDMLLKLYKIKHHCGLVRDQLEKVPCYRDAFVSFMVRGILDPAKWSEAEALSCTATSVLVTYTADVLLTEPLA